MDEQRTVLIVEDEPSIADALAELFEVEGARPVTARSLEDALEAMRVNAFDLIVTDIRLGQSRDGGLRVLARAGFLSPGALAIALTAFPSEQLAAATHRLGAAVFLAKPVDLGTIAALAASHGVPSAIHPVAHRGARPTPPM